VYSGLKKNVFLAITEEANKLGGSVRKTV